MVYSGLLRFTQVYSGLKHNYYTTFVVRQHRSWARDVGGSSRECVVREEKVVIRIQTVEEVREDTLYSGRHVDDSML